MSAKEQSFINFHNHNHRYSSQGHKTPNEMKQILLPAICYKGIDHLPSLKSGSGIKILLQKGCVYYIRFIRSDLKLYLPNESFTVIPELKYSYVVAEINIHNHSLIIRQNSEIKQVFAYTIPAIDW